MTLKDLEPEALAARPQQEAGYHAGAAPDAATDIDLSCWAPPLQSANADILPSKDLLESRIMDVSQNDGYVAGAIQHHLDHAIGTHLKLSLRPDWRALGRDEEWSKEFAAMLEGAFKSWAFSNAKLVDVTEMHNWPALQAQAYRSLLKHGEILASYEPKRTRRGKYVTRIRLIDPTRLSDPKNNLEAKGKDIRGGIEFDEYGAPVAMWISSRHPRDHMARNKLREKLTWKRYPIYGKNGRRKIFHVFDPLRADQARGVSLFAPVLRAVKMIDRVQDATLQAALLQTVFALVVKSNASWEQIMEVIGSDSTDKNASKTLKNFVKMRGDYYDRNKVEVNGAKAIHLLPDETVELTEAKASNPDIGSFLDAMREEVARGQGMTLEQLTGNYSKVNFSSARMSNIVSNKAHAGRRIRCMAPFCFWVLELFAEEHFLRHPEELGRDLSFYEDRDALLRCEWQGPPMVDADPEKTAKAAEKRLAGGYSTLEYECSQIGLDWEEVLEQQAREAKKIESSGLLQWKKKLVEAEAPPKPDTQTGESNGNAGQ